jgi:hypothetical protein
MIEHSSQPFLRRRTDSSEEASEYNKVVTAVESLQRGIYLPPGVQYGREIRAFEPVVLPADAAEGTSLGVGMQPGRPVVQRTSLYYEAPSSVNAADLVAPTLNGTSIFSDPAPRVTLAAGEYTAWGIFKEKNNPEVRIEFRTLGAGAGTIDRDEKPFQICNFEVIEVDDDNVSVIISEQYIVDTWQIPVTVHPWKAIKTGDTTFQIYGGDVYCLEGTENSQNLVSNRIEIADTGITITGAGSAWVKVNWYVEQLSQGTTAAGDTITAYRIERVDSGSVVFLATGSAPTPGSNSTDTFVSGTAYVEIAEFELSGGEAFCTRQIAHSMIQIPDLTDIEVSAAS